MPEHHNPFSALTAAKRYHEDTVKLRRWFHAHPETGLAEYETSNKIKQELDKLAIPYETAGETGLVGIITGRAPSGLEQAPVVGLRADFDALEIQEQNDVPYRSLHAGRMHACGHDAHTASLLAAARILQQERARLPGVIKLIFEPAEEIGAGAEIIINSGLVRDVNAFFGLHAAPNLPTGQVSVVSGPVMAGANSLKIEVSGRGGHGAMPNRSIDAIAAGCDIVQALQQVVAREVDPVAPAVVTIGAFHAGTQGNIIAGSAMISGTVRALTEETRAQIVAAVTRIADNVAAAHRAQANVVCKYATAIVVNDENLARIVKEAVVSILSAQAVARLPVEMLADDFAAYRSIAPAFYAKVGVSEASRFTGSSDGRNPIFYPLHSEKFNIDEESLIVSTALFVEFVHRYFGV